MSQSRNTNRKAPGLSRRRMLQAAGVGGITMIPGLGHMGWVYAEDKPAIGTWPAGSQGSTIYIAAAVPLKEVGSKMSREALSRTQALSRTVLGTASYELTYADGYMNNPYRPVWVNSERREVEKLPTTRLRHVVALSLHGMLRTGNPTVSHVALRPGLRIHADSWSLKAVNPELAGYVQLGPVEIRGLLGYYRQWAVSFYRSECSVAMGGFPGAPCYSDYGAEWGTRTDPTSGAASPDYVYTSDVKLGDYATYTWDLQIKWRLSFLAGSGIVGDRLSRSAVELSGGMWFADRAVGNQFGIPLSSGDPSAPAGCSLTCGAGFAALGWYIPL